VLSDRFDPDPEVVKRAQIAKDAYESAATQLQARNFAAAEHILAEYLKDQPDDKPAKALHSKTKGFLIVPPPSGWENVVTQDYK
jgi:hypothetical protein